MTNPLTDFNPNCPLCGVPPVIQKYGDELVLVHDCECGFDGTQDAYNAGIKRMERQYTALRYFFRHLPKHYRTLTEKPYALTTENQAVVRELAELSFDAKVYLHGEKGVGKTHLSVKYGYRHALAGQLVRFISELDLFRLLREAAGGRGEHPYFGGTQLVILDDFGKDTPTDFYFREVYGLLNDRLAHGGGLLITSNHDTETAGKRVSLDKANSGAVVSRLRAGHVLRLVGADRREGSLR